MPNQKVKTSYKIIKTPIKKVKTPIEELKNGFNLFLGLYRENNLLLFRKVKFCTFINKEIIKSKTFII
jgi:hypothetical protein